METQPMTEKPTADRPWFQFSLGTWLVLVGLLCWALAYWPWVLVYIDPLSSLNPIERRELNPALRLPALALLGFLIWKVVWLWAVRRKTALTS
jgi:hypothetical protein